MKTWSKCLEPSDYDSLHPEDDCLRWCREELSRSNVPVDVGHPHRYWEYALALRAVLRFGGSRIIDVGGGGGLFSPVAARCGGPYMKYVEQVDAKDFSELVNQQSRILTPNRWVAFTQADFVTQEVDPFDAVVCLSVLEHSDDERFFPCLLKAVKKGGVLVVTVDFHPSGKAFFDSQKRTYNADKMHQLFMQATEAGLYCQHGELPDWTYRGAQVYDYTFASLVMWRPNV